MLGERNDMCDVQKWEHHDMELIFCKASEILHIIEENMNGTMTYY